MHIKKDSLGRTEIMGDGHFVGETEGDEMGFGFGDIVSFVPNTFKKALPFAKTIARWSPYGLMYRGGRAVLQRPELYSAAKWATPKFMYQPAKYAVDKLPGA